VGRGDSEAHVDTPARYVSTPLCTHLQGHGCCNGGNNHDREEVHEACANTIAAAHHATQQPASVDTRELHGRGVAVTVDFDLSVRIVRAGCLLSPGLFGVSKFKILEEVTSDNNVREGLTKHVAACQRTNFTSPMYTYKEITA